MNALITEITPKINMDLTSIGITDAFIELLKACGTYPAYPDNYIATIKVASQGYSEAFKLAYVFGTEIAISTDYAFDEWSLSIEVFKSVEGKVVKETFEFHSMGA